MQPGQFPTSAGQARGGSGSRWPKWQQAKKPIQYQGGEWDFAVSASGGPCGGPRGLGFGLGLRGGLGLGLGCRVALRPC